MSFSVAIAGLPNVGKSTLFKALTKKEVKIAPRPFTTIKPNYGRVLVPDERLEKIANIIKPEKITPTAIEFVDIAGLVKGAHKGEGLGNQFLGHIRNCDAILEVVRVFENPKVENVLGSINPEKEIEVVKLELLMKDLETLESLLAKVQKRQDKKTLKRIELLKKLKDAVSQGKLISELNLTDEEKSELNEFQFLTEKPVIFVFNIGNNQSLPGRHSGKEIYGKSPIFLNLKLEQEICELSEKEKQELDLMPGLDKLIVSCYNILDLITFYTIARGKETKAWTLKRGLLAPNAGGVVHSDFEKKFIRAAVIPWDKLVEAGSWTQAKEKGRIQIAGRNYTVQDGDVIEFRI